MYQQGPIVATQQPGYDSMLSRLHAHNLAMPLSCPGPGRHR
jgi:hypothetical protein